MVKTTKKLLNFLQSLNKCVQKKTEKEYLFIRRYILFWGKMKTAKGPYSHGPYYYDVERLFQIFHAFSPLFLFFIFVFIV